eukprot:scaffold4092_cov24-Tisochrysis_lutea.AAC.1
MQGLRVSPRGPLPLPGKVRRATSYAGSSSGSSPQRSNTTAASLCSLDAANQPQQPVPAGRAAAGTAGTAARAQSPAADASTKVSHGRSCSYSSGSSAVGGMGGDSSHGSSPPSSVGTAYEANRAASSKITLLEDPCDMRFWSVPSMPPRSFSGGLLHVRALLASRSKCKIREWWLCVFWVLRDSKAEMNNSKEVLT